MQKLLISANNKAYCELLDTFFDQAFLYKFYDDTSNCGEFHYFNQTIRQREYVGKDNLKIQDLFQLLQFLINNDDILFTLVRVEEPTPYSAC
jgi:hypothetical protein